MVREGAHVSLFSRGSQCVLPAAGSCSAHVTVPKVPFTEHLPSAGEDTSQVWGAPGLSALHFRGAGL